MDDRPCCHLGSADTLSLIHILLSEDKCDIPGECLKKGGIPLKIAVYGVKGEERKSTGWHVTSKILFPANISVGTGGSGDPMGQVGAGH